MDLVGSIGEGTVCQEGIRRALSTAATLVLVIVGAGTLPALTQAQGCSAGTEQIRQEQVYALRLPDCRAYEQVSPVKKNGVDAVGTTGIVQASPSGDAVSFFALVPFPEGTPGSEEVPTYLGTRALGGDRWSTKGLLPEAAAHNLGGALVVGLTEDLAKTIVIAEEPPLAPGAATGPEIRNAYVRDNTTGTYQLLAPNVETLSLVGATADDSRIFFETRAELHTTNATPAPEATNLYEWNEAKPPAERVSLVGVLPHGEAPEGGSVGGPGGPALEHGRLEPGGSTGGFNTQDAISESGSRVFFTEAFDSEKPGKGTIYMREPNGGTTVQISAGTEPAYWRAATPSGSFAFYTEGSDLYRYNVAGVAGKQREAITSGGAGVLGTLGVSTDGSYVYFVANGVLTNGALLGNCEGNNGGTCNLYKWHEGITTLITQLLGPNTGASRDEPNWRDYRESMGGEAGGPSGGEKSSRVTPDGRVVLFSSVAQLTSYDNNSKVEFYLYDAELPVSSHNPLCVSCNPEGVPATGEAHLATKNTALSDTPIVRNASMTHNLSTDGNRVFFQTNEALVPRDTNGQSDVYEWESEGTGSCERASVSFSEQDGGCVYLISTGQSAQQSYFGDASADGSNAFFFTRQSLVSEDQDVNSDMYDARVEGGIPAQNPPPPPTPCAGETCRGASGSAPVLGALPSTTLSGAGNLGPPVPAPAATMTPKKKTTAQIRAEELAKALKVCRSKSKSKRKICEASARKRHGSKPRARGKKSSRGHHS